MRVCISPHILIWFNIYQTKTYAANIFLGNFNENLTREMDSNNKYEFEMGIAPENKVLEKYFK